jgi:hypothetical protein
MDPFIPLVFLSGNYDGAAPIGYESIYTATTKRHKQAYNGDENSTVP